jgi:hypothetical protein
LGKFMISLRIRIYAGLILVLFASVASSQNTLEQLAGVTNSDPNVENLAGDNKAIVLTIDGIDGNMLASGFGKFLAKGPQEGRGDSYLIEHVREKWSFADDVHYYAWSGDPANTSTDIQNLKIQIATLSELAERRGKPFIILGHSWGSVMAYRAISELKGEGKLPRPTIRKLVTIGSPLGANCSGGNLKCKAARETTFRHVRFSGPQAVLGPVESWTNFWIKKDYISGPVDKLEHNVQLKYSFLTPHNAYFMNANLFQRITEVVAVDLASFAPNQDMVASADQDEMVADSGPALVDRPVPSATLASAEDVAAQDGSKQTKVGEGKYCLSGICLAQRIQDLSFDHSLYEWRQQRINLGAMRDSIIGLSNQEFDELDDLLRQKSPHVEPTLNLLGEIEVLCALPNLNLSPKNGVDLPSFRLGVVPAESDGWQGLRVTAITRTYVVPVEKRKEFEQQVDSKFPSDQRAQGYKVDLRATAKPRSTVPLQLSLFYSGSITRSYRSNNDLAAHLRENARCPKPKMPTLE